MMRYQHQEIEAILKLFERELATLNRLSKVEKMKIRKSKQLQAPGSYPFDSFTKLKSEKT